MHLNIKQAKAAYKGQRQHVVGQKTKEVKRQGEVKEKRVRTDWLGKLAAFFGIKLTKEHRVLRQWLEAKTVDVKKSTGSKLEWKMVKRRMREVAQIRRMLDQGIRISDYRLRRTGLPLSVTSKGMI